MATPELYTRCFLKKMLLLSLVTFFVAGTSAATNESNLVVIVNARNAQALSTTDIRNIYTDRIITWANGRRIAIYQLPHDSPLKEKFCRTILGVSAMEAARDESNRRITNMMRNPPRIQSQRAVVHLVATQSTAIGYVSEDLIEGLEGIRVVMEIE